MQTAAAMVVERAGVGTHEPTQCEFDAVNASDPAGLDPDDHDLLQVMSTAGDSGSGPDSSLRNEAMSHAMHDLAAIVSSASARRVKPTRSDFRERRIFSSASPQSIIAAEPARPVLFVVVQAKSKEQVIENVELALKEGGSGVFLTNPEFDYPQLLPIVRHVRGLFPGIFLGVSFYAMNGADAFPVLGRLAVEGVKVDAYWAHNAWIDEAKDEQPLADNITRVKEQSGWDGLYFGGCAFANPRNHPKLCKPVPDQLLGTAAAAASRYVDVVITSGADTMELPSVAKCTAMREGCADTPLAVVCGDIAPAAAFLPLIDVFLVQARGLDGGSDTLSLVVPDGQEDQAAYPAIFKE